MSATPVGSRLCNGRLNEWVGFTRQLFPNEDYERVTYLHTCIGWYSLKQGLLTLD